MAFSFKGILRTLLSVDEILADLTNIRRTLHIQEYRYMSALTDLQTKVANNTSVINSAVDLIVGLKKSLDDAIAANAAGDNGAALAALSAELGASDAALSEAVTANTPAAPAPAPSGDAPA